MKWLTYLILVALLAGGFVFYRSALKEQVRITDAIAKLQSRPERDEEGEQQIGKLRSKFDSKAAEIAFEGIILTFLVAGLVGLLFVTQVLPIVAHRFTHVIYDSGEMVDADPMRDAHSLVEQGNYHGAINAFKAAAANDPLNRLPWVEISKIQRVHLEDPDAAIQTLRHALEDQEWQIQDAAFFLFRLAELYDEDRQDRATAAAIMHQLIDEFPETRHSANARHKLHEWGLV
ncbi:MAG: tetratricopeptide repeat protein [Verrucomicrobia bacterium]|nr:tetratricopeptide repeat protein [Verrucomicrobiota bacterium]